jgi:hypothetical protein
MKNMTSFAVVLASLLFSGALAQADSPTTYQTLLNAYNTATQPASAADFGPQTVSPLKCAIVLTATPTDVGTTSLGTEQFITSPAVPATPAYGPLIPATPGTPEKTATVVVLMGDPTPDQLTQDTLAVFSNQTTATDFIIAVAHNDQDVYSDLGDSIQILIRKSGNIFPFVIENASTTVAVGYCY